MPEHSPGGQLLEISPDGRYLASGGDDRLIKLWDVAAITRPQVAEAAPK